jgi:predicted secreted protein
MPSGAIRTQGTVIAVENKTTPATLIVIGEVISFDGPGGKAAIIDITNLASAAKEKLPGLPDEGQFTLSVNFNADDPGQAELRASRIAQELRVFHVTFVDGGVAKFSAYIMEFKVSGKADSKVEASIGMEISGLVTWTDPTVLDEGALAGRNHAPAAPARKAA